MVAGEGVTGGNCAKHPQLCGRAGRCWPAYRAAGDEIEDLRLAPAQDCHVLRRPQPRRDNDRGSGRLLIPAPAIAARGAPPMGDRLKAAIHKWQERRRQRRIELQERRNTARTTLRDYKRATGHEGGTPGSLG
jgi:hypothetical protein